MEGPALSGSESSSEITDGDRATMVRTRAAEGPALAGSESVSEITDGDRVILVRARAAEGPGEITDGDRLVRWRLDRQMMMWRPLDSG